MPKRVSSAAALQLKMGSTRQPSARRRRTWGSTAEKLQKLPHKAKATVRGPSGRFIMQITSFLQDGQYGLGDERPGGIGGALAGQGQGVFGPDAQGFGGVKVGAAGQAGQVDDQRPAAAFPAFCGAAPARGWC